MEKIAVRPCVILIKDNKVLVIHCKYEEEFYLFPGGGVEFGETIKAGAIREMYEETGIKVKTIKIVYINDYIEDRKTNTRVLNIFFLAKRVGGKVKQGERDGGKVKKIEWIELDKFDKFDFRPKYISKHLKEDYEKGFPNIPYFVS